MEEERISFKMVQLHLNETMLYKHLFYFEWKGKG